MAGYSITGENAWRLPATLRNATTCIRRAERAISPASAAGPINDIDWMYKSTLMAIMGRMVCYTGQMITWIGAPFDREPESARRTAGTAHRRSPGGPSGVDAVLCNIYHKPRVRYSTPGIISSIPGVGYLTLVWVFSCFGKESSSRRLSRRPGTARSLSRRAGYEIDTAPTAKTRCAKCRPLPRPHPLLDVMMRRSAASSVQRSRQAGDARHHHPMVTAPRQHHDIDRREMGPTTS